MQAIERIRSALNKHHAAKTLAEAWMLTDEIEDALSIESLNEVLAHIDALTAENERLRKNADRMREALTFYAQGEHFHFDRAAWDTVSGEPQNYWCDEEGTATVEDGTIAKLAIDAEMKGTP